MREILYLIASRETQEPRNRPKDKKCNQKINKKLSLENTVYKPSIFKYNLKTSIKFSSIQQIDKLYKHMLIQELEVKLLN